MNIEQMQETKLKKLFNSLMDSPWAIYVETTFKDVLVIFKKDGYNSAKEFIRREDISAYRKEEYACGNL
jgi:hypothetical protein